MPAQMRAVSLIAIDYGGTSKELEVFYTPLRTQAILSDKKFRSMIYIRFKQTRHCPTKEITSDPN